MDYFVYTRKYYIYFCKRNSVWEIQLGTNQLNITFTHVYDKAIAPALHPICAIRPFLNKKDHSLT